MSENKYQFKGTQGVWHAVEIAGFWEVKDEPYYEGRDLLCFDNRYDEGPVTAEEAKNNAYLMAASPDLLQACIGMMGLVDLWLPESVKPEHEGEAQALMSAHDKMKQAIHKALNTTTIHPDTITLKENK